MSKETESTKGSRAKGEASREVNAILPEEDPAISDNQESDIKGTSLNGTKQNEPETKDNSAKTGKEAEIEGENEPAENYSEAAKSDEDGEEEEEEEDDEEDGSEIDEEDLELEEDDEGKRGKKRSATDDAQDNGAESESKSIKIEVKVPKRRGRKKTKFTFLEEGVFDEDGNPINVTRDEVVIDHEDEKGKTKIDEDGNLLGNRHFRMKTFTVMGSGNKLFMISTEPARLVGFRDSYLLFKTHKPLFKKVCTNEEKMDLIDRGLIPNSYKGRSVNLVAARSIFREFGSKMIRGGRKVIDDFWEQRARDRGDVEGEFADPTEFMRHPTMPSFLVDPTVTVGAPPVASTPLVNYQSDVTWLYQMATRTKEFNSKLREQRSETQIRGIKDVYTNLNFYPESTQPHKSKITKLGPDNSICYETVFSNSNLKKKRTGLKDIPAEIFADVSPEIREAILEQQRYESIN